MENLEDGWIERVVRIRRIGMIGIAGRIWMSWRIWRIWMMGESVEMPSRYVQTQLKHASVMSFAKFTSGDRTFTFIILHICTYIEKPSILATRACNCDLEH